MSTNNQKLGQVIFQRIRDVIFYNWEDIQTLSFHLVAITLSSAVLTYVWSLGWGMEGVTWHVMYTLEEIVPGPPGPVFVAPLGLLLGLIFVFWFDPFKRLQGLFLLVPGVLSVLAVIFFLDRLRVVWTAPTILVTFLAFGFGLLWAGFEGINPWGDAELERGFKRLVAVVGLVGALGIFEATVNYELAPLRLSLGNGTLQTSPLAMVVYGLFLVLLLRVLSEFTKYEMEKDILILGPDRGGKTWFMSGGAYCLRRESVTNVDFDDPAINESLLPYVNLFFDEEFDDAALAEGNDPDEFDFFSFKYEHGVLPKRRLRVKTVDYAGEHLQSVDLENPREYFNSNWANKDGVKENEVPSFGTLRNLNQNDDIDPTDIPPLLSLMIEEYDTIALMLPSDEFTHDLSDNDLPNFLDKSDLEGRRSNRTTDSSNGDETGYFQIYEKILRNYGDKNVFFVVTMSDAFLETFKDSNEVPHQDPKGNQNWDWFCKHVYGTIKQINDKPGGQYVDFMGEKFARNYRHYYPVYFEADDPPNDSTSRGNFRPKLDHQDDYYPIRGLEHLLKRMGK